MPDLVNGATTTAATTTPATTTSGSCAMSELLYDESDDSEFAAPDMDSQLLYVKLKEVCSSFSRRCQGRIQEFAKRGPVLPPFPSFPLPSLLPFSLPSPLEVGPFKPARDLGERCHISGVP